MRLALLVSIPASCFIDQQGLHDKNLKGDICGFPNWDWKISKQSLSMSEHCKKTTHHTKWPCLQTQRTREDAILKRQGTCFNPHLSRQIVNCYGRDNRGCCEYRLPKKTSLEFPYRNRVTMQARSGELWWSTEADDSYSSSYCFFQSMWHSRRRCV